MEDIGYLDEVQTHILGVVSGLMMSYGITVDQVATRYNYCRSLSKDQMTDIYERPIDSDKSSEENCETTVTVENTSSIIQKKNKHLWSDYESEEEYVSTSNDSSSSLEEPPLYVKTRREFCATMQKGIKICPRYSTCEDQLCKNFHIESEYLCSHKIRGNYCDNNNCELIVIRACRKGKKCNDSECSFRHP